MLREFTFDSFPIFNFRFLSVEFQTFMIVSLVLLTDRSEDKKVSLKIFIAFALISIIFHLKPSLFIRVYNNNFFFTHFHGYPMMYGAIYSILLYKKDFRKVKKYFLNFSLILKLFSAALLKDYHASDDLHILRKFVDLPLLRD